jgi:hypothetical protein
MILHDVTPANNAAKNIVFHVALPMTVTRQKDSKSNSQREI